MATAYVVEGPRKIGNGFGFYGKDLPEGKYAVVANGEYANGGYGPARWGRRSCTTTARRPRRLPRR